MIAENVDKALFYAIKRGEMALAKDLYQRGANLYAIFEEEKGEFISSLNLFIRNFSRLAHSKGTKKILVQVPVSANIVKDLSFSMLS
jgi:hypothetical protein